MDFIAFLAILIGLGSLAGLLFSKRPTPVETKEKCSYCFKCGAKVSTPMPCNSEVLLEIGEPMTFQFDPETGKRWLAISNHQIFFDNYYNAAQVHAKCEKYQHKHFMVGDGLTDDLYHRLPENSWKYFNLPGHPNPVWHDRTLWLHEPRLHNGHFLRVGPCQVKSCPNCGVEWPLD